MSSERRVALLVALSTSLGACSSWGSQYRDRAWYALVAVPTQALDRADATTLWVSIDGTAYPVTGAKIYSPVAKAPLQQGQLGVVEREMWFRSTSEDGNFHGIKVPLRLDSRVESRNVLIEVASDQPCQLGQPARDIIVHHCSGKFCSENQRVTLAGDGLYRIDDVRVAVTVVCARRKPL
jgi:hypothetical protein